MRRYTDYHSSYENLRSVAVGAEELLALVREMPKRCQAVIDAKGRHTKYQIAESKPRFAHVGGLASTTCR